VFDAFTRPELLVRWYGAHGWNLVACDVDLRVGGAYRFVMIARGGHEVAFHGEFREIVPNERLVHTEIYEGAPDSVALNLITFSESDGRTTVEMLTRVDTKEIRDIIIGSGMEGGMQEGMDLLEELAVSLAAETG
jgi:uncharacterized protein YndB with AHSA1/START domain